MVILELIHANASADPHSSGGEACIYQHRAHGPAAPGRSVPVRGGRGETPGSPAAAAARRRDSALVTLDNLWPIARPQRRRRVIRMSALSTFDGSFWDFHGPDGYGESGFDSGEGA